MWHVEHIFEPKTQPRELAAGRSRGDFCYALLGSLRRTPGSCGRNLSRGFAKKGKALVPRAL